MVRFRLSVGFAAAAMLTAALVLPGSTTLAAPVSADATRKQATERLFNAVYANDYSAVQASVGTGADVDAVNNWGVTAAELAVDKGYFRIAHYLVSVRNFQRGKTEQLGSTALTTPAEGAAGASVGAPPAAPTKPAPAGAAKLPAHASAPTTTVPIAAATAPIPVSTRREPAPTIDSAGADDAVNPFDPSKPSYGAQVPTASN